MSRKIQLPILMYHQIGDNSDSGLTVSVESFAAQMQLLKENGYHTVSLENMACRLEKGDSFSGKGVVITFDDGFKNIHTNAYPILEAHGFSATVFLVADFLGKSNNWSENKEDLRSSLLSIEEIASMPNLSYGSHSLSHRHLTQIPESEAYEEVVSSRKKLEDQLQVPIHSFCYPYGDYNESLVCLVEQAGYCCACSTRKGNRHGLEDRFLLKRIPVTEVSIKRFKYRLSFLYDWEYHWGRPVAE